MAGKRIEIMDLRQLLTLKNQGISNRKVAQLLQISRNTVNGYTRLLETQGLSYEALLALSDATLQEFCAPQSEKSQDRYDQLASCFDFFYTELRKPGCTLLTLWHWYQQKHPGGYAYTQVTKYYSRWVNTQDGSGKMIHKAGEKVFVDYTGKKLFYVDKATGEQIAAEVFVGILPCSQYTFVEASSSQKREDLFESMKRCLEYFGGAPQAIVPDNLKSAVSKASNMNRCSIKPSKILLFITAV